MRALVLGAAGQLGAEMVRLLGRDSGLTRQQVSITDEAAVDAAIGAARPRIVFNCAAYNAVDRAESEPEQAFAVNADGPRHVAAACARYGARLVHFSTNFVFDGSADRPYVETDTPAPRGVYAASKLEGERRVLETLPGALVVRTAAVFGGHRGDSFPEKILAGARQGRPLRVVGDQSVNPTSTVDLAAVALEQGEGGAGGVVHAVAAGCCAWDEFARAVLAAAGLDREVTTISSAELAAPAPRPANGCLGSVRIAALRPWQDALEEWTGGSSAGVTHP